MGSRREAREIVLQCLYQWDQQGPDDGRALATPYVKSHASTPEAASFADELLAQFWEHSLEVDESLSAAAQNWSVHRMAVVDRNILRLAITELCYITEVPPRVAIDEAIELAKKFSTEKSGAFVNGILDRILSEHAADNPSLNNPSLNNPALQNPASEDESNGVG